MSSSKFILSLLLIQLSLSSLDGRDYTDYKLLKVAPTSTQQKVLLYEELLEDVDFWTEPFSLKEDLQFMVGPNELHRVLSTLKSFNISSTVLMENVQDVINDQLNEVQESRSKNKRIKRGLLEDIFSLFTYEEEEDVFDSTPSESSVVSSRSPRKINSFSSGNSFNTQSSLKSSSTLNWKKYYTVDAIHDFLYETARKRPDISTVFSIGRSYEGRELLVMKVGDPNVNFKPAIFIEGGIHAREWISPATVTYIINELVSNYDKNADILNTFDFYILPVLNPDGYAYTFRKDRLWRKSRSRNGLVGSLFPSCVGVDLNRNFGFKWLAENSLFSARGGSRLSCLETYAGPKPFSEPETKALSKFLKENQRKFKAYLSIHSFGQKIIYPWSYTNVKIKDWKELHAMGNVIANTISKYSGVNAKYDVGTSSEVQYRASGGADDFARGALGIKWVYLIELPDKGLHGFLLPPFLIQPVAFSVFQGIREFATQIA